MNRSMPASLSPVLRWLPLLALLASGCATNPVSGEKNFVMMSEDQEIQIGRESDPDVRKVYGEYDDPELQAYVQRIGEELAAKSHRPQLIYRFTVLDSPTVNAFALPGGYIYITRGIMAYLNSEAELAAVLGHEIGHVTARHGVRQYSAAMAANVGYTIGAILVPELQNANVQDAFKLLSTSLLRGYGREHELESDRLGAEYLARSSYDPDAMIDVVSVLKGQEEYEKATAEREGREARAYHGVFATHPSADKRLQEVVGEARKYQTGATQKRGRDRYLEMIDGMVFGDSEKEGIRRGNRFYHKPLDFQLTFPQGWNIENRPSYLAGYAPKKVALLHVSLEDRNRRISPREFVQQRLEVKGNRLQEGRELRINGMPAFTGIATMKTPYGTQPTRVTVAYFGDKAMVFLGATKDGNVRAYDAAFLDTVRSLSRLDAEGRRLAEPLRIDVRKGRTGESFTSLARESAIPNYPEIQLRLINDQYPEGDVVAGAPLKLVQ